MELIRATTYARAGLLGNPSDGYNGKTISVIVPGYHAEVVLYEWDSVDIVLTELDRAKFKSIHDLVNDVALHGYYGGIRLIKAAIKKFADYCSQNDIALHDRNFSVRYASNIPRQVGLAGSSAIITSTLRCLLRFYDVEMPADIQPSFVLSVERDELGIAAGLQDRVVQSLEGMVYMDFSPSQCRTLNGLDHYHYERLEPVETPKLYVSHHADLSEPTETFHDDVRGRYLRGDADVVKAMEQLAELAEAGRTALLEGETGELGRLIDANFDTRMGFADLPRWQIEMVRTARELGATAKFAGSGGAIIGTYEDDTMFRSLRDALAEQGCRTTRLRTTLSDRWRA